MKVIMIKDYKNNKVNDVIEVADGFGKNFLLKNGYAISYSTSSSKQLDTKVAKIKEHKDELLKHAQDLKVKMESLELSFELKTTNNVVHGSITRKQIVNELRHKGYKVDPVAIEHVQISSIGITNVNVKLHKEVMATLKVKVING